MIKYDLQFFGGRGASGTLKNSNGKTPNGRRMSVFNFLANQRKHDKDAMLDTIGKANLKVNNAMFTKNGNAVDMQEAVLEHDNIKVSVRFFNRWEPTQTTKPNKPIRQAIEAVTYKDGNVVAMNVLAEKKSTSLKNAEKNYNEMLDKWKKLTKQKSIKFS